MATKNYHVQVRLPALDGLTRDVAINDFAFQFDDAAPPLINAALTNFYNTTAAGGTHALAYYLALNRSRAANALEFRYYNVTGHLNGSASGPPEIVTMQTLAASSGANGLTTESAYALSFHGDYTAVSEFAPGSRPRSRYRGRIYLGPLNQSCWTEDGSTRFMVPATGFKTDCLASLLALAADDVGWCVWSRANATMYPVIAGWVDNAFDTIRGRGERPTFRQTFELP